MITCATLGISSRPPWRSGFRGSFFIPAWSRDPTMTELTLIGLRPRSGTLMIASNEPSIPVWFSRTTTFNWNSPGGSSRSVWYCTFFRCTSSVADTDRLIVSRMRATGRCCGSRTTASRSSVALSLSLDFLNCTFDAGTTTQSGTK